MCLCRVGFPLTLMCGQGKAISTYFLRINRSSAGPQWYYAYSVPVGFCCLFVIELMVCHHSFLWWSEALKNKCSIAWCHLRCTSVLRTFYHLEHCFLLLSLSQTILPALKYLKIIQLDKGLNKNSTIFTPSRSSHFIFHLCYKYLVTFWWIGTYFRYEMRLN